MSEADKWLHAYVDETGTNELDTSKSGVSKYFICVAVIVDDSAVANLTTHLDNIANELCGGAEIASKNIRNNHKRRKKFLERLNGQKFGYYGMLIRKDAVPKESGLRHKRSFYKCINKMLYERVSQSGQSLTIIADTIGGVDFMDSFDSYLKRKLKPDLFFRYEHRFEDSSASRLIQLADLIAGTLGQCFEPSKQPTEAEDFRKLLGSFEMAIDVWPPKRSSSVDEASSKRFANSPLTEALIRRVERFIHDQDNSEDATVKAQVSVLKMLMFAKEFEPPGNRIISSKQLISSLVEQGHRELSVRAFTEGIIGGIRQKGIIIAGTNHGYKIAFHEDEIREYLEHNKSIIEPMLARLAEARKTVKVDTANEIDILSAKRFQLLGKLVDCSSIVDDPENTF